MSKQILCQSWDTNTVHPAEQFEYFADGICSIFSELYPETNEPDLPFRARLSLWETEQTAITRVHSTGYNVRHIPGETAKSDDHEFYLNHIISGKTNACQHDESVKVADGNFYILDNSKPFELNICPNKLFRTQIIRLPHSQVLEEHQSCLFNLEKSLGSHRLMPLLKFNLAQFAKTTRFSDALEVNYFGRTIASLMELMLTEGSVSDPTREASSHVELILSEIDRKLLEPDFSLEALAFNLAFSSRHIQKVLAGVSLSFSDYLLDKRLAFASTMLMQQPHKHSVEQIAYASGFRYLSTFYRGFRRKYGMNPGDLRGSSQ